MMLWKCCWKEFFFVYVFFFDVYFWTGKWLNRRYRVSWEVSFFVIWDQICLTSQPICFYYIVEVDGICVNICFAFLFCDKTINYIIFTRLSFNDSPKVCSIKQKAIFLIYLKNDSYERLNDWIYTIHTLVTGHI